MCFFFKFKSSSKFILYEILEAQIPKIVSFSVCYTKYKGFCFERKELSKREFFVLHILNVQAMLFLSSPNTLIHLDFKYAKLIYENIKSNQTFIKKITIILLMMIYVIHKIK